MRLWLSSITCGSREETRPICFDRVPVTPSTVQCSGAYEYRVGEENACVVLLAEIKIYARFSEFIWRYGRGSDHFD